MNYNQEKRFIFDGTVVSLAIRTDADGRAVVRLGEAPEGVRSTAVLISVDEVDQLSDELKAMSALCRQYNAAIDELARKEAADPLHCLATAAQTVVDKESIVDKDEDHVTISLTRDEYEAIQNALQEAKKAA